jgi:hypothetical protein
MLVQLDPVFVKISDRVLIGSMHTKLIPPRYPQDQGGAHDGLGLKIEVRTFENVNRAIEVYDELEKKYGASANIVLVHFRDFGRRPVGCAFIAHPPWL